MGEKIQLYVKKGRAFKGSGEKIMEFFEQFLFDVGKNDESVSWGDLLHTKIFAYNDEKMYVIGIRCNPKGSMTAELYDIECRSLLRELIELNWKVGDYRGLRQDMTNKFFIDNGVNGFLNSVFYPTISHLKIHSLELGSSN
jgi:hypothetical protein